MPPTDWGRRGRTPWFVRHRFCGARSRCPSTPICRWVPADPLTLARCAANRLTPSGRVAGPEQRVSVHDALRAVTIEAAFSWRMEHELGSITAGKAANFTVLGEDPYTVDPRQLNEIPVLGTVYGGRWFPAVRCRT
jgi:predicted amidohydrolase YtcJ